MLPRKCVPDGDLILYQASPNRTMMTTNVHPLYLPPVVCWLNRTHVQVLRVRSVLFNLVKVISIALVSVTLFVHILRLWNLFAWGLLGALWSLMVCISLIGGAIVGMLSAVRRSARSDTRAITDPMATVSISQKLIMFIFFLVTYIYTWLYYRSCGSMELVVSRLECSDRRGACLFPILTWTTFVFVWINTIGFITLVRAN